MATGYGGAAAVPRLRWQLQAPLVWRRGRRAPSNITWKTPRMDKPPELQITAGEAAIKRQAKGQGWTAEGQSGSAKRRPEHSEAVGTTPAPPPAPMAATSAAGKGAEMGRAAGPDGGYPPMKGYEGGYVTCGAGVCQGATEARLVERRIRCRGRRRTSRVHIGPTLRALHGGRC